MLLAGRRRWRRKRDERSGERDDGVVKSGCVMSARRRLAVRSGIGGRSTFASVLMGAAGQWKDQFETLRGTLLAAAGLARLIDRNDMDSDVLLRSPLLVSSYLLRSRFNSLHAIHCGTVGLQRRWSIDIVRRRPSSPNP